MLHSAILSYIRNIVAHVPVLHWAVIGVLSLVITLLFLFVRKFSAYVSIVLGITVFIGLFLLDAAVFLRLVDILPHGSGFSLKVGFDRLFHGTTFSRTETLSNIAAFIPFGLFLSEFLASSKWFSAGRRLGLATLAGFGLSLCIECLQLVLHVGFFELTDLVMNTLGAFVGAGVAALFRRFLHSLTLGRNDNNEIPSLRSE